MEPAVSCWSFWQPPDPGRFPSWLQRVWVWAAQEHVVGEQPVVRAEVDGVGAEGDLAAVRADRRFDAVTERRLVALGREAEPAGAVGDPVAAEHGGDGVGVA